MSKTIIKHPSTPAELVAATEDLPLEPRGKTLSEVFISEPNTPARSGSKAVIGRTLEDPSEADIATLKTQYRKAINGLYEAWCFGQMLANVKNSLTRETVSSVGRNSGGMGLKGWLSEHCPEINYKTALRFLSIAENTTAALPEEQATDEAAVRAYLAGKSQRQVLRRGGAREGAGRPTKDYAKALDSDGQVAWHEIEEPLQALSELIVTQRRHERLSAADLETLRASIDLIHETVHQNP